MDLLELAARCEAATGADTILDNEISIATKTSWADGVHYAPRYTASLDAAMCLAPDGWYFGIFSNGDAWCWPDKTLDLLKGIQARAATPALALCAAALRARASQTTADDGDER